MSAPPPSPAAATANGVSKEKFVTVRIHNRKVRFRRVQPALTHAHACDGRVSRAAPPRRSAHAHAPFFRRRRNDPPPPARSPVTLRPCASSRARPLPRSWTSTRSRTTSQNLACPTSRGKRAASTIATVPRAYAPPRRAGVREIRLRTRHLPVAHRPNRRRLLVLRRARLLGEPRSCARGADAPAAATRHHRSTENAGCLNKAKPRESRREGPLK